MSAESGSRRPVSSRLLRVSIALCLGVAGVGTAADPPPAAAAPAAVAEDAAPAAHVTVAPSSSGALRPKQDLRVSVLVTNTGLASLPEGSARLVLGDSTFATSQELGAWLLPQDDAPLPAGTRLGTKQLPEVGRGATSLPVEFTIPVDRLKFLAGT